MPLPKPRKNEKQADFVSRCMADDAMNREYPKAKQRAAVCHSQWRSAKKKQEDTMPDTLTAKYSHVPAGALHFSADPGAVSLSVESGDGPRTFSMKPAYSGVPFKHWWWGNFAIDLESATFNQKIGLVWAHDTDKRLGVATDEHIAVSLEAGITVTNAPALQNDHTESVLKDADQGFPFEASVYAVPGRIEMVPEGETLTVNGHELAGPGHVFRDTKIKHIAVCVHGADDRTESIVADGGSGADLSSTVFQGEKEMEVAELTIDELREGNPDLYGAVLEVGRNEGRVEASDETRKRVKTLTGLGVDENTARLAVLDGKEDADIIREFVAEQKAKSEAELKERDEKIAALANGTDPVRTLADADPKPAEPTNWAEAKGRARAELGDKAEGREVVRLAAKKWPELYRAEG